MKTRDASFDKDGDGFTSPLTRRSVLLGTSGALAAAPFLDADDAGAQLLPDSEIYGPGVDVLSAVIGRVFGPRTMFVIGKPPGRKKLYAIPVGLIREAVVETSGAPHLQEFLPGDEVLLGGRWEQNGMAVAVVQQTYRVGHGRILKRRGNRLVLKDSVVRIAPDTRALGAGDHAEDGFVYK